MHAVLLITSVPLIFCIVNFLFASSFASIVGENAVTNCSTFQTYGACSPHLHCSWCGEASASYPSGLCFDRAAGLSCCETKNAPSYCYAVPQLCTQQETCYLPSEATPYGNCTIPACCGGGKPKPCAPACVTDSAVCCGLGLSCASGQSCCGGKYYGFACCDAGATCCAAPDGYAHWCCPAGQTCDSNRGCDSL